MPVARIRGIRLFYEERGMGAPAILLIHGSGSSAAAWGTAPARMAARGRVIAYDRRGCTRSERPVPYERTRIEEHSEDAHALLRAREGSPAVIIGRSFGASVALDLAVRHPGDVLALVLLEPAIYALDEEAQRWADARADRVRAIAKRAGPKAATEAFYQSVVGEQGWQRLPAEIRSMFLDNSRAVMAELEAPPYRPTDQRLASLRRPVLLVHAERSGPRFRRVAELLAARIPRAEVVAVDGGHLIDPCDPAVQGFVARVTSE